MTGYSIWADYFGGDIIKSTQHDAGHFDIALELARYVVG